MAKDWTSESYIYPEDCQRWENKAPSTSATTSSDGLMSKEDKIKLNGISVGADKTPGLATNTTSGLMSGADKAKLGGIEAGANKYILPSTLPSTMITQDSTHRFVTDLEKAEIVKVKDKADKTYVDGELAKRVEKVAGKGLSANDYSNAEKQKVADTKASLNSHLGDITNEQGRHGIRYWQEKLEIKVANEWFEFKSGSQYPVGNVSGFEAEGDDAAVELTWKDPADRTVTDDYGETLAIAKWKGTKILRKVGSYPQNENDGVLVVDNGVRDQYATNGFIDTGLVNDTDYYYMAFPYTEEDVFTVDEANRVIGTPTEIKIYGFEIDESNTNPKTAVTYIGDAVGMTPASGNNGNFNWGSWKEFIQEISKPVVMKAGVDQYDLNYDDYTKKATGGNSILTGADGDVFTKLQHLHMKHEKITNGHRWLLASKPFDGSFSMTEELENGYNQFNNPILVTLQNLYLLIFKDRDSQTALGRGRVDGAGYIESGNTNSKGYMFGSTQDLQMKFLGIEDFWGNKYQWVDGLMSDSNWDILHGAGNFNDTGSGYAKQTTAVSANIDGYPMKVQGGKGGYVLADSSASGTTGYADYGHLYSGSLARFGGYRSIGGFAGAFDVQVYYSASDSNADLSARLCYKNADAVYIGAYLGYEQGGKLRSISGNMPTGTKTISQFRTLAQANN